MQEAFDIKNIEVCHALHKALREKGVDICQRSVSNVLDRYDELLWRICY